LLPVTSVFKRENHNSCNRSADLRVKPGTK
jgi:hypothetical protein